MVCNFGTIPINKTKMQAANLTLNGDNKVSQNKEYTVGHRICSLYKQRKNCFKKKLLSTVSWKLS